MLLDLPPLFEAPASPAIVRAANLDSIRPWREVLEENWRLPYWKERQERFKDYQNAMRLGLVPLVPALATLKSAPITCAFHHGAVTSTNASDYTFSSVSFGTANPLRWIVIGTSGSYGATPSAVTVDGAAITPIGILGPSGLGIVYKKSGTSGTVFIDGSATNNFAGIVCYSIVGLLNGEVLASVQTSGASPQNFNIAAAKGGCIIGVARLSAAAGTVTGANENYDTIMDGAFRIYGYSVNTSADSTAHNIVITSSGSTIARNTASWAP